MNIQNDLRGNVLYYIESNKEKEKTTDNSVQAIVKKFWLMYRMS